MRVEGSEFRVRVQGSELRVQGPGFRVQGLGSAYRGDSTNGHTPLAGCVPAMPKKQA